MNHRIVLLTLLMLSIASQVFGQRNDLTVSLGGADVPGFGDIGAIGLNYNRFFSEPLSGRFGVTFFGGELEPGTFQEGDLGMAAFTAGAQYQFLRGRRFSPYVGGGAALVVATLFETEAGDIDADETFTAYVHGGADINLGQRFAINLDLSYMPYEVDFQPIATVGMDPLTFSVGAKFRW